MSFSLSPGDKVSGSSAERSLRLLSLFAEAGHALSLAELTERLQLPKATVHRLCMQLLAGGYLARDIDVRFFVVGPTLRRLAFDTLNHDTVRGLRHEILAELVEQVGETCNLTTLDGASVLYMDRVEAPWPWRLTLDVGAHVPLHCTASGKLFLALMPGERRETILAQLELPRMTAHTIVGTEDMLRECEMIARNGYSVDKEEFIPGLVALAVPIFDAQHRIRAAVAVHAPTARLPLPLAMQKLPFLRHAATRLRALF